MTFDLFQLMPKEDAPTIFNIEKNIHYKEPMFFGHGVNISRFDQSKYHQFNVLTKAMLGYFWQPEEVNLSKDKGDFYKLSEHEKHIFTANLKYQTLLDSIQGRGPMQLLMPILSLPELEPLLNVWSSFESSLHSRAYSHIIQNVYSDPSEVLDEIINIPEIIERAKSISEYGDKLLFLNTLLETHRFGIEFADKRIDVNSDEFKKQHKKTVLLYLFSVYMLEAVRFYISFSCTFAFAENKLMEGSAKIVRLIARDEAIHTTVVLAMLQALRDTEGQEWRELFLACESEFVEIARQVFEQEKDWAKYLFKDGGILGLNYETSIEYLKHIIDNSLSRIGLNPLFENHRNPYPWIVQWFNSDEVQVAPQETENTAYIVTSDSNISDAEIDALKDLV